MRKINPTLIALLMIVILASCSKDTETQIVGAWYSMETADKAEFFPDGSFQIQEGKRHASGSYTFPDETHLRLDFGSRSSVIYTYNIHNDELVIVDVKGDSEVHTRNEAKAKTSAMVRAAEARQ